MWIHRNSSVDIARCSSDYLQKRFRRTQKTLFVSIDNSNEWNFWKIKSLPQQIDSDYHLYLPCSQITQYLKPLQCLNLTMEIWDLDSIWSQIFSKLLWRFLSQSCDKHPFIPLFDFWDVPHYIIDHEFHVFHLEKRIKKSGRSDNLLNDPGRLFQFKIWRSGGYIDSLSSELLEFWKFQRTILKCARQTEAILDKALFSCSVSSVHSPDLGYGHMRLIYESEEILRKEA
ncbi:MAG: hypothetical protein ACD_2C00257G0001 [uncultured bacterium (gcode 4)]|uniref:Uncharacterized protein n=1 Tax=uncultured bacterium (gcode 4) TaxID=1234023 RepID=K2G3T5_9BACT|nr:MAG: hypothetical protein ACD_2C00257G0001 [uncultured bacterium (gcode 4)]